MTTPVIIDLIAAAVLAGFTIAGARRGLFRTLAGVLIVALAMFGAHWVAERAAPRAAERLAPVVERRIGEELEKALPPADALLPETGELGAEELLGLLGLRGDRLEELAEEARESARETGVSVLTAAAMGVAESFLYSLIYLLSFALLLAGLKLAARAMDLMMRLPVLHTANALCGGAAGMIEGLLILLAALLVLSRLGVSPEGSRTAALFSLFISI